MIKKYFPYNTSQFFIKFFVLGFAIISSLFFIPKLSAQEPTSPTTASIQAIGKTVAVVNNEPIFSNELEREAEPFIERYQKTAPKKDQTKEKVSELKKEILNRLIEEKLLFQEAKNKKVRVTKTEIDKGISQFKDPFAVDAEGKPRDPRLAEKAFQEQLMKEGMTQDQFNKRVEEQLMKVKLIEMEVKSKVEMPKEEEVRNFFNQIQKKIEGKPIENLSKEEEADLVQISKYLDRMMGEQFRIRHILIRSAKSDSPATRAEAKKKLEGVLQRIKNGEDFAFLSKKFSDDPISRERGGDLGFIAKGDIGLPEVDEVLSTLKEGNISGIIETEIGFHIIKMVEKKTPHPLEFEDVREDLANYIAQRTFTQKLEKYLENLRTKASIKVNPIE